MFYLYRNIGQWKWNLYLYSKCRNYFKLLLTYSYFHPTSYFLIIYIYTYIFSHYIRFKIIYKRVRKNSLSSFLMILFNKIFIPNRWLLYNNYNYPLKLHIFKDYLFIIQYTFEVSLNIFFI